MKISTYYWIVFALMIALPAHGQESTDNDFVIGYSIFEPFSFHDEQGALTGFDFEYWTDELADSLAANYTFKEYDNITDKLNALESGEIDMAIGGVSITFEREKRFDYSTAYFDSGLGILVHNSGETSMMISSLLSALLSPAFILPMIIFIGFIAVGGLVMWWSEIGNESAISDKFVPGIFEGMWCAFATATTIGYGDIAPKKWLGRVITAPIALAGFIVLATFMGSLSSTFTMEKLSTSSIQSPSDLKGKTVVTKAGTTSAASMRAVGAYVIEVGDIKEGYTILRTGNAAAVVSDIPNLKYFLNNDSSGEFSLAGSVFEKQDYGFVFRENDPRIETISQAHLVAMENGHFQKLYKQYFGNGK